MKEIFGKKIYTAIDIGAFSIKLIQVETGIKNKNLKLNLIKKEVVRGKFINDGKISRSRKLAEVIKNMINHKKMGKIVTTFSNSNLILRNVTLPVMAENDIKNALKMKIEDYIPYLKEKVKLEYLITETKNKEMQVLLVAVKKKILQTYMEVFRNLNCEPEVINIQPMAIISLLELKFINNKKSMLSPGLFLDIGYKNSTIFIGDLKSIYLIRTIKIGGRDIKDDEEKELNADFIKEINQEIKLALEFYQNNYKNQQNIKNIYLIGGGSEIKGLKEIIVRNINLKIRTIPLNNIFGKRISGTDFLTACGLIASEVFAYES